MTVIRDRKINPPIEDKGPYSPLSSPVTLFCFNCLEQFATEEEAREHWANKCKYGGYLAPINDIIRPIKVLPKRKAQLKKVRA